MEIADIVGILIAIIALANYIIFYDGMYEFMKEALIADLKRFFGENYRE